LKHVDISEETALIAFPNAAIRLLCARQDRVSELAHFLEPSEPLLVGLLELGRQLNLGFSVLVSGPKKVRTCRCSAALVSVEDGNRYRDTSDKRRLADSLRSSDARSDRHVGDAPRTLEFPDGVQSIDLSLPAAKHWIARQQRAHRRRLWWDHYGAKITRGGFESRTIITPGRSESGT